MVQCLNYVVCALTLANEDVTEDPQRTFWRRNVDACHAEEANDVLVLDDVIVWSQLERLATEGYLNVRKARDILTRYSICGAASHDQLAGRWWSQGDMEASLTFLGLQWKRFRANHGSDPLDFSSGPSQNGGACIQHDAFRSGRIGANGK